MSDATTTEHDHDAHGHNHSGAAHSGGDHSGGEHEHHAVSWQLLTIVFLALMVLTFLTVAAINVDLGPLNLPVAMGIALVKAVLVVLIFMHIWWDRAFHGLCIIGSLGFVTLFIGFVMMDTWQYEPTITAQDGEVAHDATNDAAGNYVPPPGLLDSDPH